MFQNIQANNNAYNVHASGLMTIVSIVCIVSVICHDHYWANNQQLNRIHDTLQQEYGIVILSCYEICLCKVSCRQLVGSGRTGHAYVTSSPPDVKVVSESSAASEQHTSPPPPRPTKSVIIHCSAAIAMMLCLFIGLVV